jgi:hypothetical protein
MASSYKDWTVSGYVRPVMEQVPRTGEWTPSYEKERVCVITDPGDFLWEVVVESGRIASLTIQPSPGVALTQRKLSAVPLGYLRDAALSYWREVDSNLADLRGAANVTPEDAAMQGAAGASQLMIGKPKPREFAVIWKSTPARQFDRKQNVWVTRRDALRVLFRRPDGTPVSLATIDSWTRAARDLKLIEAATTGKPRDTKTTGKEPGTKGTK